MILGRNVGPNGFLFCRVACSIPANSLKTGGVISEQEGITGSTRCVLIWFRPVILSHSLSFGFPVPSVSLWFIPVFGLEGYFATDSYVLCLFSVFSVSLWLDLFQLHDRRRGDDAEDGSVTSGLFRFLERFRRDFAQLLVCG